MRKRYAWSFITTPWDGQPGFWAAWNRLMYLWEGPAQLGDPDEAPPKPTTHAACPLCGAAMSAHDINRDGPNGRTLLRCPDATSARQ